jgi:hypothetical protein
LHRRQPTVAAALIEGRFASPPRFASSIESRRRMRGVSNNRSTLLRSFGDSLICDGSVTLKGALKQRSVSALKLELRQFASWRPPCFGQERWQRSGGLQSRQVYATCFETGAVKWS